MSSASTFAFVSAGCAVALAAAAAVRAHRSLSRWAFSAGMALLALESILVGLSASAQTIDELRRWQEFRLLTLSFVPLAWLLFSASYARGNGREFLKRGRVALLVAVVLPAAQFVLRAEILASVDRAAPVDGTVLRLGWAGMALCAWVLVASVLVVMNLERTFRASVGTIRWRIKSMLLGVGVLFVARIYTSSQSLVFRGLDPALDRITSVGLIIGAILILRSLLRAGHFDLDVYPSHSVLQNSVTVLFAGVYLLIVGVLAKAVAYFGGDGAFAVKTFLVLVALVGLAVLLQSDHVRLRLRRFVSRHFQRPLYDYRSVWQKFSDATASCVDQADLSRALARLVADVFQTLSVTVWLVNDKKDTLLSAASTTATRPNGHNANTASFAAAEIISHLQAHPEPADIDRDQPWAAPLREHHPAIFPNGGHRACVPLVRSGEFLGVLIVGDRVGGAPLSLQDFEMLKCICDQAAASMMNVQLSQRLVQAKELEAFQAMAAFFVHDLKNAASTLNLTLQNLPIHFDNPEFRADALRGIAKTVTHINHLIGRLSALRRELKIELADADLNEVVNNALAGLEHAAGPSLLKEIEPLPRIPLDREQLNKVVTNLVLNATEAAPHDGRVRVATAAQNGWVVLTVDDNGCGMSDEFMNQSLFRPFQTTKKNGLGIGMFQTKMIVEAHGGRIAVASRPGKGTTFQVYLRAPAQTQAN